MGRRQPVGFIIVAMAGGGLRQRRLSLSGDKRHLHAPAPPLADDGVNEFGPIRRDYNHVARPERGDVFEPEAHETFAEQRDDGQRRGVGESDHGRTERGADEERFQNQ